MNITIKTDELQILLEQLNDEREVKIKIGERELKIRIGILAEVISLCVLMGLLGYGVHKPSIIDDLTFKIYLWKWVILSSVIIFGWWVSHLIVRVILCLLKLNRFCGVRILFFVIGEKNSLHGFLWSIMVFLAGYFLIHRRVEIETDNTINPHMVFSFMILMMIGCFAWLTMSTILKLHRIMHFNRIYFDRVKKLILEQCILRMLLSSPEHQNHEIIQFKDLNQLSKKDASHSIVDKLMNMVRDESLPSVEAVVTKSILQNILKLGFSHVVNIKKFLLEKSSLAINFFEKDEINEKDLHHWVMSVYKDRRVLMSDMRKTNTDIEKMHIIVIVVVGFIILDTWFILAFKH